MSNITIRFILLGLVLLLAQVIVFNHVCLFHVASAFVFIYLIIRLPLTMPVWQVLTVGFFTGLIVDMFSDTPGMNSMACTIIAMARKGTLRLYFNREDDLTDPEPSVRSLGLNVYMKFIVTVSLIYCTVIFVIQGFTIFNVGRIFLSIIFSTLLTSALLLGIDSITVKSREKRL